MRERERRTYLRRKDQGLPQRDYPSLHKKDGEDEDDFDFDDDFDDDFDSEDEEEKPTKQKTQQKKGIQQEMGKKESISL